MNEQRTLNSADRSIGGNPADPGPRNPDAAFVSLERLEERICELAAHLAAATCRFLQLVAEFDARQG